MYRLTLSVIALSVFWAACSTISAFTTTSITPIPITPSHNFPAKRSDIESWIAARDLSKIRQHAWHVWGGMTADSGELHDGINLPVWDTWLGNEQIFIAGTPAPLGVPARAFKSPAQASHGTSTSAPSQVVSFNKFNPSMADYLGQEHPGPGSGTYNYTQKASLGRLNKDFNATQPPIQPIDRQVVQAPYSPFGGPAPAEAAIETKPVFNLVKATGLTAVPLWRGYSGTNVTSNAITEGPSKSGSRACTNAAPTTQQTNGPAPESWTHCVILDPANSAPSNTPLQNASRQQILDAKKNTDVNGTKNCTNFSYAPISTIYNFAMSKDEAKAFASAQGNQGAARGDFAVLVAMHVNTKETINWTWQTFWWQPDDSVPRRNCKFTQPGVSLSAPGATGCPGSKQDMTSDVMGEWKNYAMCTAYAEPDVTDPSKLTVCYNPFLETNGIPSGASSNCMTCHGTATVDSSGGPSPLGAYPVPYLKPIGFGTHTPLDNLPLNECFDRYTRSDFSWAIPDDAQ